MGGTSTDVSLINGCVGRTSESELNGLPMKIPMIDIHTVGAGGGSIAYVDSGGALKVGPGSAGAMPGPACYGTGDKPTVTDANLYLGRIDPDYFLGGGMQIYPERSRKALEALAKKIDKTPLEAAEGIIRVADSNMEKALRVISIERGVDPRDFYLFSFGGAGGLHAVSLAERLRMAGVIVPRNAGVLSAFGLLLADSIRDYSSSLIKMVTNADARELEAKFKTMEAKGFDDLKRDGFGREKIIMQRSADMRYKGQSFEITVPFPALNDKNWRARLAGDFQDAHERLYSYKHPNAEIEIVTLRVKAIGRTDKIKIKKEKPASGTSAKARVKQQKIFFEGKRLDAFVYERDRLGAGHKINGPALIIDKESTAFLPLDYSAKMDEYLNIIINRTKR
jgi:N-methylhydantoinase A/oxoprolinase/acetone carboxylase beta subunit